MTAKLVVFGQAIMRMVHGMAGIGMTHMQQKMVPSLPAGIYLTKKIMKATQRRCDRCMAGFRAGGLRQEDAIW